MPQTTIKTHKLGSTFSEFEGVPRFRFVEAIHKVNEEGGEYVSNVVVKQSRLLDFIKMLGYRSIEIDNVRHLVQVQGKIIEPITIQHIRQKVMNYINSLNFMVHHLDPYLTDEAHHTLVKEKFANGIERLFNKHYIHTQLFTPSIQFNKHTRTDAYYYFKNTAVKVTAKKIEPIKYEQLPGYIWANQIIDRDYTKPKGSGVFEQFINLVSGQIDANYNHHFNKDKKQMLMCMLGYLCHNYSEGERRMVVFTDESTQEDMGRTGKGLILGDKQNGALRHFLGGCFAWVNGKTIEIDKPSSFSECNIDTQVIHIDDLNKNLTGRNIDLMFPMITAGIETKKLYQDKYFIKPKIAASTNKIINVKGDSVKGRVWIIPLARYFNAERTPYSVFKCWFYSDDWNAKEWAAFDLFFLQCVQAWFMHGFFTVENIGIEEQMLSQQFDSSIREFIEDELHETIDWQSDPAKFGGLSFKEFHVKDTLNKFLEGAPKDRRYSYLDVKEWRNRLQTYCNLNKNYMSHSEQNLKAHKNQLYRQSGRNYYVAFVSLK